MSTVLVTGVDGFTGRYLAKRLRDGGHRVAGLARTAAPSDHMLACDLTDGRRVSEVVDEVQPDLVVHLAAVAFVASDDVERIYRTNIIGTRNLLESLTRCSRRPDRVLLASSANVYGNTPTDPIVESVLPLPENDYAISKLAMEHVARTWAGKLPIVIARPFNYTGVGQSLTFLLPKIVDHFRRRAREIDLGNVDVARDFSDVRTVVDAYARLLVRAAPGETFNICSGRATSIEQILDSMAEIAGYRIRVNVNPALVRDNEIKRLRGSNCKLVETIGELEQTELNDTLRWMFEVGGS